MTRISFYVLPPRGQDPLHFACRLTEKAAGAGEPVYVYTQDHGQAEKLDTLMWTFRQGSFLPHELWQGQADSGDIPALIGAEEPPGDHHAVLINLAEEVPSFFSRYERVLEIVDGNNPGPGRARYKFYQDRGYPLDLYKIGIK